jgi:hypothetical protein
MSTKRATKVGLGTTFGPDPTQWTVSLSEIAAAFTNAAYAPKS